jgi:hydrogenase maturation protease
MIERGSRVRLLPREGADVLDRALTGRTALVDAVERDMEGGVHVAVMLEDDPGVGGRRRPGARFFFRADEVEVLAPPARRVLVAGIGNVFMGDDGFGVEVVRRLAPRAGRAGVDVRDFGIRGMDLVFALADYDVAILVDATPRGAPPGTVELIEAEPPDDGAVSLDTHGMDPVRVLALARELGPLPERVLVVGCEPASLEEFDGLSEPVQGAVAQAAALVRDLVRELTKGGGE